MARTWVRHNIALVTVAFAFAANGWDNPDGHPLDAGWSSDSVHHDRAAARSPSAEEIVLATRLRAGESAALDTLVARHYVALLTYLSHALRSEDIASDLLQELFVHVWRRRETFPLDRPHTPYLIAAARNRLLDYIRAHRRAERKLNNYAHEDRPAADDPLLSAEYAELARAAREAIERLPVRGREIWRLSREQGLTFQEIAELLGISTNTVKTHMARAMAALRVALLPYLER